MSTKEWSIQNVNRHIHSILCTKPVTMGKLLPAKKVKKNLKFKQAISASERFNFGIRELQRFSCKLMHIAK